MDINIFILNGITRSNTDISLEHLSNIRPFGVVSKKSDGALSMQRNKCLKIFLDALSVANDKVIVAPKLQSADSRSDE